MNWKAVFFDLDGTLVQTAPEITDALNDTLRHCGWPEHSQAQVEAWIGQGTRELLVLALAQCSGQDVAQVRSGAQLQQALPIFDRYYQQRCGTRSQLYPRVRDTLRTLRARGCRLAVVTNKEGRYTETVLRAHGLWDSFELVVSGDSYSRKKPDPVAIDEALARWGIGCSEALFVGDSSIDAATARNAGIAVWLLPHGYNMGAPVSACQPDRVIADFSNLI